MAGIAFRSTPSHTPYEGHLPQRSHRYSHLSGRPLDFCLLAVCSCLLSLMCHQTGGVTTQTAGAAAASPPQIDFVVKAGLATTARQNTAVTEEEEA
ncbi:MAG: hypothetical protein ACFB5Z_02555 [Elainellaceae cyanobacterium]